MITMAETKSCSGEIDTGKYKDVNAQVAVISKSEKKYTFVFLAKPNLFFIHFQL